jgi:lipid II:glycine glycyltransferase (peptidoglycan interpeptide bridge formation enzyme)
LKALFPENIRQFNVYQNGVIVAGTTIFEASTVAHCQYISGKEDKNELGGLDLLFQHLISDVFKNRQFFDFGISNENQGRKLNNGLSYWKESFGASTIVHDFYEVESANFNLLDNVLK